MLAAKTTINDFLVCCGLISSMEQQLSERGVRERGSRWSRAILSPNVPKNQISLYMIGGDGGPGPTLNF